MRGGREHDNSARASASPREPAGASGSQREPGHTDHRRTLAHISRVGSSDQFESHPHSVASEGFRGPRFSREPCRSSPKNTKLRF